ncbi:hypothetical protein MMPV_002757 [Pyropia vietnamensis]
MHRLRLVTRSTAAVPTSQLIPASFCAARAHFSTSPFAATPAKAGDDPPGRGGNSDSDETGGSKKVSPPPHPASSPAPASTAASSLDDPLAFLDDLGIGGPGGGDGASGSRTRPPPPPPPAASSTAVAPGTTGASWPAVGGGAYRRWSGPGGGGGGGGYGHGGDTTLPDDPMFSQSATAGVPDLEVRRMAAVYRLVREHADATLGTGPPVDTSTNVLLGSRLSPIRSLPRVAPAVLAELRHQLPAEDAAEVLVSASTPTPPPSTAAGRAASLRDGRAAAEAALWRRVDASTMDPHSFARLLRASALAPSSAAVGADGNFGVPPGTTGAPGSAGAPLPPGGVSGGGGGGTTGSGGGGGSGGRSRAAVKAAARAACPLSDARGRVDVDYRQVELLRGFLNPSGRILGRRAVGTTAKAQRRVSRAIKTARQMALLNPTIQTPIAYSDDRGVAEGRTGL